MRTGKYKDKKVDVIRGANPGDGEGFDKTKPQILIRLADGSKKIVLITEVALDPEKAKA